MIVDILGTKYQIIVAADDLLEDDCDGVCFTYTKQIRLRPKENMLSPEDSERDKAERWNEVIRHEIIHAFLFESGLGELCEDERLVDWIAKQFPKMAKTFDEVSVGC